MGYIRRTLFYLSHDGMSMKVVTCEFGILEFVEENYIAGEARGRPASRLGRGFAIENALGASWVRVGLFALRICDQSRWAWVVFSTDHRVHIPFGSSANFPAWSFGNKVYLSTARTGRTETGLSCTFCCS